MIGVYNNLQPTRLPFNIAVLCTFLRISDANKKCVTEKEVDDFGVDLELDAILLHGKDQGVPVNVRLVVP